MYVGARERNHERRLMLPYPLCRETRFGECLAEDDKRNILSNDLPYSSIAWFTCPTTASMTRDSSEADSRLVSSKEIGGDAFESLSDSPPGCKWEPSSTSRRRSDGRSNDRTSRSGSQSHCAIESEIVIQFTAGR